MTIDEAKRIHIGHFLSLLGHTPVRHSSNDEWYISPFRDENTASFHVFRYGCRWHDFGEGSGGDIIDLTKHLYGIIGTRDALLKIQEITGNVWTSIELPGKEKNTTSKACRSESASGHDYKIKVSELSLPLLQYSRKRAIGDETIKRVCSKIHYTVPDGRRFFGIGFQNDKGGWEVRSEIFKGCLGLKAPTSYLSLADVPTVLFEGFFDYLSALELGWVEKHNAVILNSVQELDAAISLFFSGQPIITCLDNDAAGRKAVAKLMKSCNVVDDWANRFPESKDLNDYLLYLGKR